MWRFYLCTVRDDFPGGFSYWYVSRIEKEKKKYCSDSQKE